ncbi:hypothetical protein K490DRAFT_37491 [Saccharata proteae CBS 121410]|uniref:RRN7-type domain-containing protein n=1 Tax=Saccharata proteae CBS 121410 TaxID=1314787 RepID=A0A6A5YCL3_9PEZI|nr:hypothetical protein K490DRAFT_37491 [Saccharata proteae CBS 121410]
MKGVRCGVDNCRSKRYHFGEDSYAYCENGHRQEVRLSCGDDEDAFNQQGKKFRAPREKVEKVTKLSTELKGAKAVEQYILCYQVVLWKQARWLVQAKNMPPKLEEIIRDLWAIRLPKLISKIESADEIRSESQLYSSQSEGETDTEGEASRGVNSRKLDAIPHLIDTLALCYFGMLLLRLPACLGDLYSWAASGELLYYRALQSTPYEMRARLPGSYVTALDPDAMIKPAHLETSVQALATAYIRDVGMSIPPLNHPLLLFRYMKDLALPLDIYPAVNRLAQLVGYDFSFPQDSARKFNIVDLPEAQLAALVVVAVKLSSPFDGLERNPTKATDYGALVIDWPAWIKVMKDAEQHPEEGRLNFEQSMSITEQDIFSMADKEMDDYLDFYDQTLVDHGAANSGRSHDFSNMLFKMFPTGSDNPPPVVPVDAEMQSGYSEQDKVKAVVSKMKVVKVVSAEDAGPEIRRPGSYYKRYRRTEDLGDVARAFYTAVAKQAGMSMYSLIRAVFLVDQKLYKWCDREKRREAGLLDDEMDVD